MCRWIVQVNSSEDLGRYEGKFCVSDDNDVDFLWDGGNLWIFELVFCKSITSPKEASGERWEWWKRSSVYSLREKMSGVNELPREKFSIYALGAFPLLLVFYVKVLRAVQKFVASSLENARHCVQIGTRDNHG